MPQQRPARTCPRCGASVVQRGTGRPATWCSQACRRAAYEERREATEGAVAVRVVDRVELVEHDRSECAARVIGSPAASSRVLQVLAALARDRTLTGHPKWSGTLTAADRLCTALARNRRI